ncbi:MAG: hypothetical protein IIX65_07070 [Lachnospiraceae bacterium]|nr:hypothetical protein [Lachnospiraceae bacterium]
MLDQSDLKILGEMFLASEERMMKRMDEKIDELDARLGARIDEIDERLSGRIDELDTRLGARIDEIDERLSGRIDELDTRLSGRIDSLEVQMKKSENLFMTELGRTCDYLERKIDAVQKDVNELKEYYRIQRLEDSNTATLLRLYTGLRAEVDELKVKIA